MKNNHIKQGIELALMSHKFESDIDRIIISCILYDYIQKILKEQPSYQNNSKDLASSYLELFLNEFKSYKSSAVSYTIMRKLVEKLNKGSILQFYDDEIREVIDLYNNKTAVVPFSSYSFSQYMYRVLNLSHKGYRFLSEVHKSVMVPILQFYKNNYEINDSDMEIYSAEEYPEIPGKEILFSIKGINSTKIASDIKMKRIPLGNKIYRCGVKNSFVNILLN